MLKLESTMQTFSLFLKIAMEMSFAQQETNSVSGQVPASLGIHLFFFRQQYGQHIPVDI